MKHIFTFFLIALSLLIISCGNDDQPVISPYEGNYMILTAESDAQVDLDANGTAHTDLMAEIEDFHNVPYDIILNEGAGGSKYMNFYIPHPNVPDDLESFAVAYAHAAWAVQYEYLPSTNEIKLVGEFDDGYYRHFGVVQSVEILNDTTLKCTIKKDYYDYQINDMKNILLTLVFQKQAE